MGMLNSKKVSVYIKTGQPALKLSWDTGYCYMPRTGVASKTKTSKGFSSNRCF